MFSLRFFEKCKLGHNTLPFVYRRRRELNTSYFYFISRYLNLDEQQKQAVVDLRALLEAAGCLVAGIDDDYALLRFLKAREFDVEKASAMYQEMAKWRQENQVDTIMDRESFPETDALLEVRGGLHTPRGMHRHQAWHHSRYLPVRPRPHAKHNFINHIAYDRFTRLQPVLGLKHK